MAHGIVEVLDDARLASLLGDLGRDARRHRFAVAPNPCVGAAVLAGTRVVARGFHEFWGEAHAEINALRAAQLSGVPQHEWDTLVVTLEPCSSEGKTGSCVNAIREAGIRRVVVGSRDPDPRHLGSGLDLLREAGIEVVLLDGASPLYEVAPHFESWTSRERLRRPRPWTIAKWAQTRTGQLSPPEDIGEGRWITCEAAQREVHELRGRVDAIVTGVGTVLEDNPRLTVRPHPPVRGKAPMRVVLDSYLRTPPESALFAQSAADEGAGDVHILCLASSSAERYRALRDAGANVQGLQSDAHDSVDLRDVQTWLSEQGVQRVLLEAGPTLLKRYLDMGFVDQVRVYTGDVNGGRGESMGSWLATAKLSDRLDRDVGTDAVIQAFLQP